MSRLLTAALLTTVSPFAIAAPFETCPSKAYLFQSSPVQVYSVNLVTGSTTLFTNDVGLSNQGINAVGFDNGTGDGVGFEEKYIYGFEKTRKKVVRLDKDFQADVIKVSGLPNNYSFYVGDVYDRYYYLYGPGRGFYRVDLTPLDSDPNAKLTAETISTSAPLGITDFAFHPGNDELYAVNNSNGKLYEIDTNNGSTKYIGSVGVTGTFGAGYFDVNGYYYISRNQDGDIFRIDLSTQEKIDSGSVTAVKFADGPKSGLNDGARCEDAPVIDEDSTIDFGDAPDSYKTLLASNGPRHEVGTGYYLGLVAPDSEGDGLISPLDDNKAGSEDEDGVGFVTAIEAGNTAIISVQASTTGYLSAWLDWNQDGDFEDADEKIVSDSVLNAGTNTLSIAVPSDAAVGSTFSRFRFSEQAGLDYFGGATTGEVEDHPVTVMKSGTTLVHYPNERGYATLAFEDNWPKEGDYDMNDVVIRFRITETLDENNQATRILISGYLSAYGAGYHNGFAMRLPGLNRVDIDNAQTTMKHNGVVQESNGMESDATEAIFVITDDLKQKVPAECNYYRTAQYCQEEIAFEFEIDIYPHDGVSTYGLMDMPYDPFIFATPGPYVRDGLWYNPGRGLEIHLADQAPTEKFDAYWYGWWSDAGNPAENRYFKTSANLPWALLINDAWKWPQEHVDLIAAYPEFAGYAETSGVNNTNWYMDEKATLGTVFEPEE
ncbi:LruC domain-containing protein [Enterovibrio norvegicus FF-33]|uniref:LruC domain-containing protein n=1 Tax=Enterovibrio norvegicus FF-454 TaxID=1185651 RepID=A0A1E5CAV6_9GAMM|nr:LruC domain-containing protein [Enterovibrio norvegicus]OEE62620.1 LruC domain-containing protein [Enterovibrio norvegicus FF-454]OEE66710.1 LruC domain-containing protein [Enterovibrio norvegicus FF-33]